MLFSLVNGDCLEHLKSLDENSFDSLVTDPPAGINFMGKNWDSNKGGRTQWIAWMTEVSKEMLRVLKPGAHGLVWAIPRTSHWTAFALEKAGFEVRDCITHLFGQGFPKSTNLAKHLDKGGMLCQCYAHEEKETKACVPNMPARVYPEEQNCLEHGEVLQRAVLRKMESSECRGEAAPKRDSAPWQTGMVEGNRRELRQKHNGREKPFVEGGQVHRAWQGLCNGEVSRPSEGEAERLCVRAHSGDGKEIKASLEKGRGGPSQKSQSSRQSTEQPHPIRQPQRTLGNAPQAGLHCSECGKVKKEKIEGLGTALKPAAEFWWLIRKPLSEKTVAKNVLKHGTGGINIDASRIGTEERTNPQAGFIRRGRTDEQIFMGKDDKKPDGTLSVQGRFPANLILSHHPECVEVGVKEVKAISGGKPKSMGAFGNNSTYGKANGIVTANAGGLGVDGKETVPDFRCHEECPVQELDRQSGVLGGASRFFFTCQAAESIITSVKSDPGLRLPQARFVYKAKASKRDKGADNKHPTVKSTSLMEYLIKLVTPPEGIVLDPFMGSGSTGVAAVRLGFRFYGIEQDQEYFQIAARRVGNGEEESRQGEPA